MLLPLYDSLKVQHVAALRLLRFQWLNPANHVLRPALMYGRDLVVAHQPTRALLDFTHLPPIGMADELWMSVHWLPRIAAQSLQSVALIFRREHLHNQMAIEATLGVGRHLLRFDVQVFEDPAAALDWLTAGDPAAARAVQAEWETAALPVPLSI